jgi:hypothetical protein
MSGHSDDLEGVEFGGEVPTVEVVVYRDGAEVHRELCETVDAAAVVIERWSELEGVECVVDDISAHHEPGEIPEPEPETIDSEAAYPHETGSPGVG